MTMILVLIIIGHGLALLGTVMGALIYGYDPETFWDSFIASNCIMIPVVFVGFCLMLSLGL